MEWAGFFHLIQSWGPSAISSALVFVVIYLIKKVDTNSKEDAKRSQELRDYINNSLNRFGERLSIVEKDYVKNEFFYQNLSGWRSEINRLSDQINTQFSNIFQSIVQLLKGNK